MELALSIAEGQNHPWLWIPGFWANLPLCGRSTGACFPKSGNLNHMQAEMIVTLKLNQEPSNGIAFL